MKNIIFDLCGVIIKSNASSILKKFNVSDIETKELSKFFSNYEKLDKGYQTLEEKFDECNFSIELQNKYKDILLNYYEYRDINMDLINLINKLKSNNYKVYILSNNPHEAFNYYVSNPLLSNIDGYVGSCDYGTTKEEGKLFEVLMDKYNLNPSECYFIDDRKVNVETALKHNIKAYQFNENEDINKLYSDMKKNGILI